MNKKLMKYIVDYVLEETTRVSLYDDKDIIKWISEAISAYEGGADNSTVYPLNRENELLVKIASLNWKLMINAEKETFGNTSDSALIAYEEQLVYIIDGNKLVVVEEHDREHTYMLLWQNEIDEEGYLV